jgi:DNA repair protein RadC
MPAEGSITLRETALYERPRERLERCGAAALSDTELLALILRSGTRGADVLQVAATLIARAGSIAALIDWSPAELRRIKGIGRVRALELITVLEIARRSLDQRRPEKPFLRSAADINGYMQPLITGLPVEKLWVLALNRRGRLLECVEVSSGTVNAALAHPREVFRAAVRASASSIICAHNHPSGDPTPSRPDVEATRLLREAARTLEIELMDHVIVGRPTGRSDRARVLQFP